MGDVLGGPAKAFMAGLMLLAGLILLAACANLGSLFAARAADRAKEVALRLALGSRRRLILRQLLTEAVLVSLAGGVIGLAGGVVILRGSQRMAAHPGDSHQCPCQPRPRTYAVALLLALVSGLLFGMVPVRQVLRADPWQIIRTGHEQRRDCKRFTLRDVLLVAQIAICAVLVTSSLVAVRGLARSLHSNFGFDPQNVMLVNTDLQHGGIRRRSRAADAAPHAGCHRGHSRSYLRRDYISQIPAGPGRRRLLCLFGHHHRFPPHQLAADAMNYIHLPRLPAGSGHRLLAGQDLSFARRQGGSQRGPGEPPVSPIKVFGSCTEGDRRPLQILGRKRAEVVGVVEDGKYRTLTEDQMPAMFFSFSSTDERYVAGGAVEARSARDCPRPWSAPSRHRCRVAPRHSHLDRGDWIPRCLPRAWLRLRWVCSGMLGAMLAVTGIFGMASYVVSKRLRELGIRVALGASREQVLHASLGRAFRLLAIGSVVGLGLGLLATRVLSFIVYQATPKDPDGAGRSYRQPCFCWACWPP